MEKEKVLVVQEGAYWAQIQALAQNAVVQVFAQAGCFNWIEPYNVVDQYESRGSGFFINAQGYIATNYHVVAEAKYVWIQIPLLGRQPIEAEVVGICPDRDLALLRLKEQELQHVTVQLGSIPFLALGDSDTVMRTQGVLALGYPLGQYRLKSTTGVVSGHESVMGRALIQTTATINPGSSGGPLLGVHGQVIGIIVSSVMPAENTGYAIPVNEFRMIADALYTQKLVRKPLLGVLFAYASDEQARYFGNPLPAGLSVTTVYKGLLFDQAGIRSGDMLYELNGHRIDAYGGAAVPWSTDKVMLSDIVWRVNVGEEMQAVVYRRGERIEATFTFDVNKVNPIRPMFPDYEEVAYEMIGGTVLMQLADNHLPLLAPVAQDLVQYYRFENKSEPILVLTHVLPGSYAHQLRSLQPGDIIVEVNDVPVNTLQGVRDAMQKSVETGFVAIKTQRNVLAVFALARLLHDEERLSTAFGYPTSPTIAALKKAYTKEAAYTSPQ